MCICTVISVGRRSRSNNGNGNGYKNSNENLKGYRIMNGNEEQERLDRNIGTNSSGTRSFTRKENYIVLI